MKLSKLLTIIFVIVILAFWFYLYQNYTVPILMYHSLDASKTKNFAAVETKAFYQQMQFIKKWGYKVILLEDYCRLLNENKPVPRNLVVLTFDDGYKDNLEAIKILNKFGYPATIFLIVNEIGKKGYLNRNEILAFLADSKVRIGSHTLSHPDLPKISSERLEKEILGSKDKLTESFSYGVKTIAYPGGAFSEQSLKEVQNAGYLCACTTNRGFSKKLDRFTLRRIKITNRDSGFSLWAKLSGFYDIFKKTKKPY